VRRRIIHVSFSILLALFLWFSGCLGIPEPAPEEGGGDDGQGARDGGPGIVWQPGAAWRYAVSGSLVETPGFATFAVVAEDDDSFLLGVDDAGEAARAVTGTGGVLVGQVAKESLAPHVDGAPRDLLGLGRGTDDAWELRLLGSSFMMVKGGSVFVDGFPGHRVAGSSSDGKSLIVEYSMGAGWFSGLYLQDRSGGLLLGYRLVEATQDASGGFEFWHPGPTHHAFAAADHLGRLEWSSGHEADRVLVHVDVRDDRPRVQSSSPTLVDSLVDTARGLLGGGLLSASESASLSGHAMVTIMDPDGRRVVELRLTQEGPMTVHVEDQAGTWRGVVSSGGPAVEVVVYEVQVDHYRL
jgi:hypothetical protein